MKFSIHKGTSDDETPRYNCVIQDGAEIFTFYCGEADIQMMQNALTLQVKPHPQMITEGCPCRGFKTCKDCAANYTRLQRELLERGGYHP